jgi:hypothetical protein
MEPVIKLNERILSKKVNVKGLKANGQIFLSGDWFFPIFENVQAGWVDYQPGGGKRRLWIDDFVIFRKRLKQANKQNTDFGA